MLPLFGNNTPLLVDTAVGDDDEWKKNINAMVNAIFQQNQKKMKAYRKCGGTRNAISAAFFNAGIRRCALRKVVCARLEHVSVVSLSSTVGAVATAASSGSSRRGLALGFMMMDN